MTEFELCHINIIYILQVLKSHAVRTSFKLGGYAPLGSFFLFTAYSQIAAALRLTIVKYHNNKFHRKCNQI